MNRIEELPNFDWSDHAKEEIDREGASLIARSDFAWQIGHVAVVGLIYGSLMSPPWMWMALTKGITLKELLDFRRRQEFIPPGTMTAVDATKETAVRFAELFGFVSIGTVSEGDRQFILMRRG